VIQFSAQNEITLRGKLPIKIAWRRGRGDGRGNVVVKTILNRKSPESPLNKP
jgi:hypothetical protein